MSYSDVRSMPLVYRRWFIKRLADEFKKRADAQKKASDDKQGLVDIPMCEIMSQISNTPSQPTPSPPTQASSGPGRTMDFK